MLPSTRSAGMRRAEGSSVVSYHFENKEELMAEVVRVAMAAYPPSRSAS